MHLDIQLKKIMAQKSSSKKNDTYNRDVTPMDESFPLVRGMKGKLIEALQKELKTPEDGFLGLQTEDHIMRLGYVLPLSEHDYRKIVKSEYIRIFEWIIKNIDQSDNIFQLDGCLALVNFFKNRKFKKDNPNKSEIQDLAEILEDSVLAKRETIYVRNQREKKNNS